MGTHRRPQHGRGTAAKGFTIVEMLFSILIIFLLMGLLIAGIRFARNSARSAADRTVVAGLKNGVSKFKQEFGFLPPLVADNGKPAGSGGPLFGTPATRVIVYSESADSVFLKDAVTSPDQRFSIYAMPYYLLGVLDLDGVPGAGFRTPKRDGTFEKSGRTFEPFFDTSRNARAVFETVDGSGRIELRDSRGAAIRYYRWLTEDEITQLTHMNIPAMVGDPAESPDLKSAEYAIVAAGPNGLFGDEDQLPAAHPSYVPLDDMATRLGLPNTDPAKVRAAAKADNIVEVGR